FVPGSRSSRDFDSGGACVGNASPGRVLEARGHGMNIDQIFAERRRKRAFVAMRIPDEGWVELPGNVVFDGVLQRFYDLGKYYESEYARPWYRFTRRAVVWVLAQ